MDLQGKAIWLVLLLALATGAVAAADDQTVAPAPLPVADFQLADFKGHVVLLDFWASWCLPCRHSLPWLNAMQQKYGDQGLQVVMINLDRDPAAAAKMAAGIADGIRQFTDPAGDLAGRYELEGMPSSYLYDRSGELIESHVGFLKADGAKREKTVAAALEGGSR